MGSSNIIAIQSYGTWVHNDYQGWYLCTYILYWSMGLSGFMWLYSSIMHWILRFKYSVTWYVIWFVVEETTIKGNYNFRKQSGMKIAWSLWWVLFVAWGMMKIDATRLYLHWTTHCNDWFPICQSTSCNRNNKGRITRSLKQIVIIHNKLYD